MPDRMEYRRHFRLVDDISDHFDAALNSADVFLQSRYVGFYAVSSAAVLELALKEVVINFARHHHSLFGTYIASRYERINGKIKIDDIVKEHLKPFGRDFQQRFERLIRRVDQLMIRRDGFSIKSSYGILLTSRHQFAHEGSVPETATYAEIKKGFEAGKLVMSCLAKTLETA